MVNSICVRIENRMHLFAYAIVGSMFNLCPSPSIPRSLPLDLIFHFKCLFFPRRARKVQTAAACILLGRKQMHAAAQQQQRRRQPENIRKTRISISESNFSFRFVYLFCVCGISFIVLAVLAAVAIIIIRCRCTRSVRSFDCYAIRPYASRLAEPVFACLCSISVNWSGIDSASNISAVQIRTRWQRSIDVNGL